MASNSCSCDPASVNPSEHFFVKGKVHLFIVLNLRDFTRSKSRSDFERLRGGEMFARTLRNMKPSNNFLEDENERETIKRGHEFQVFRGHVKDDWLYPTYILRKEKVPPPPDPLLVKDWSDYEFRVRLSRTGFLEVKLTKTTKNEGENIVDILRDLMEMGARGKLNTGPQSLQLKLAIYCADWFIKSIPQKIAVETKDGLDTEIFVEPLGPNPSKLPYRQRYMILFFSGILCQKCGNRIDANKLWLDYRKALAAILEGVLVEDQEMKLKLPEMDAGSIKLEDLASWEDDLCIFAPERALIYFPEKNIYLSGQTGTDAVQYEHYWECIARGIEHTIVVRAALQIIEYYTTRDLDEVPRLTKKVVDGEVSNEDKQEISRMAQAVANTFNMLPLLRDVLVPSSSYRASYAVNKFERLNEVLHLKDIEQHVERNVDELVSFVQFFSSMELQDELNKNEETINRVGIVIALVALVVAGPSFLADYHEFAINLYNMPDWTEWTFSLLIGLFAIGLIASLYRKPKKFKQRLLPDITDKSPE